MAERKSVGGTKKWIWPIGALTWANHQADLCFHLTVTLVYILLVEFSTDREAVLVAAAFPLDQCKVLHST